VWKDLLDGRQVQDNFHKGIGQSIHVHPGLMQVASKDVASKDNCQSWRWRHLTLEALRQQRNRKKEMKHIDDSVKNSDRVAMYGSRKGC
jgi:hypothetical protein